MRAAAGIDHAIFAFRNFQLFPGYDPLAFGVPYAPDRKPVQLWAGVCTPISERIEKRAVLVIDIMSDGQYRSGRGMVFRDDVAYSFVYSVAERFPLTARNRLGIAPAVSAVKGNALVQRSVKITAPRFFAGS